MIVPKNTYLSIKENSITGRYVINEQVLKFLKKVSQDFRIESIGISVQGRTIKSVTLGNGAKHILMWSQMHGNESTTTKAVLDIINFLRNDTIWVKSVLERCTIKIIPILNPDGAEVYTRTNANAFDLNRDAQDRTQPESNVLRSIYEEFQPHYCFNLHDQRTIFNVGTTSKPATVSFLAPAHDKERSISKTRGLSMQLIVAMNRVLQTLIPGQVGRYDDSFNINCIGDTFQMLGTPTMLFEAGHFTDDYEREQTRYYVFQALQVALRIISTDKITDYAQSEYFHIPENDKLFFDVLIKNMHQIDTSLKTKTDYGILFKERLMGNEIKFVPQIEEKGDLTAYFGHQEFDCSDLDSFNLLKKEPIWQKIIE